MSFATDAILIYLAEFTRDSCIPPLNFCNCLIIKLEVDLSVSSDSKVDRRRNSFVQV